MNYELCNAVDALGGFGGGDGDALLPEPFGQEDVVHVAAHSLTGELEEGLLARPEPGEGEVGMGGGEYLLLLVGVHGVAEEVGTGGTDALHINANGTGGEGAEDSSAAVAEVEMQVGVLGQIGLAAGMITEGGNILDAILLAKCLLEQEEGHCPLALTGKMTVAQDSLAPPLGQLRQELGMEALGGDGLDVGVKEYFHGDKFTALSAAKQAFSQ